MGSQSRVADIRKMLPEKVHELGEGRLWLGKEAVRYNLVDETGGLHDAISHIKTILNVKRVRLSFLPRQPLIMRLLYQRPLGAGAGAFESLTALTDGYSEVTGLPMPHELARVCLSVHGQPLLMNPFLSQFLPD